MGLFGVMGEAYQSVSFRKSLLERKTKHYREEHSKLLTSRVIQKLDGLVALSYYDSKPFYMMSNAIECIEWLKKRRKAWRKDQQRMALIEYNQLNVMDEYNYNMNNVDIADQLRGSYRFDH